MVNQRSIPKGSLHLLITTLLLVTAIFSINFKPQFIMQNQVRTLIYHKVADFDRWKNTFEGAKEFRKASGELSFEIGTLRHDPSVAYVLNTWTSADEFQRFVSKPELAEAMKQSGVLEPPTILVFDKKASSD